MVIILLYDKPALREQANLTVSHWVCHLQIINSDFAKLSPSWAQIKAAAASDIETTKDGVVSTKIIRYPCKREVLTGQPSETHQ